MSSETCYQCAHASHPDAVCQVASVLDACGCTEGYARHHYQGLAHLCHPDDFHPCCPYHAGHPIHLPPHPPPRACDCGRLPFRHYHDRKWCPA